MNNFSFEGKIYRFDANSCYDLNGLIRLPDGRILEVTGGWLEVLPPKPLGLKIAGYLPGFEPENVFDAELVS